MGPHHAGPRLHPRRFAAPPPDPRGGFRESTGVPAGASHAPAPHPLCARRRIHPPPAVIASFTLNTDGESRSGFSPRPHITASAADARLDIFFKRPARSTSVSGHVLRRLYWRRGWRPAKRPRRREAQVIRRSRSARAALGASARGKRRAAVPAAVSRCMPAAVAGRSQPGSHEANCAPRRRHPAPFRLFIVEPVCSRRHVH